MIGPKVKLTIISPVLLPLDNSVDSDTLTTEETRPRKKFIKKSKAVKKKKLKEPNSFGAYYQKAKNGIGRKRGNSNCMFTPQNMIHQYDNSNEPLFKVPDHRIINLHNVSGNIPSPTFTPINRNIVKHRGNIELKSKRVLEKSNFVLNKLSEYFKINGNVPKSLIYFDVIEEEHDNDNQNGGKPKNIDQKKTKVTEADDIFLERKKLFEFFIHKLKTGIERKNFFAIYESLISMYETGNHFFDEIETELNLPREMLSDNMIEVVLILRPFVENNMKFGKSLMTPKVAQIISMKHGKGQ